MSESDTRAAPAATTIDELLVADDPERWERLGFRVTDGACRVGRVTIRLLAPAGRRGIRGWSLREIAVTELDGLVTSRSESRLADDAPAHPNGVVAIDHVVAVSDDLDRTVNALRAAGVVLRRMRQQPSATGAPRQAFFRLGAEILEVVQAPGDERGPQPARFWGLALLVEDLDRSAEALGESLGTIRPAVQGARRIATVRRSAGLSVPLALISAREDGARAGR